MLLSIASRWQHARRIVLRCPISSHAVLCRDGRDIPRSHANSLHPHMHRSCRIRNVSVYHTRHLSGAACRAVAHRRCLFSQKLSRPLPTKPSSSTSPSPGFVFHPPSDSSSRSYSFTLASSDTARIQQPPARLDTCNSPHSRRRKHSHIREDAVQESHWCLYWWCSCVCVWHASW